MKNKGVLSTSFIFEKIQYFSNILYFVPASIVILAMIIGSLVSGPILDGYGRRAAHIILGVPLIIGWIVIACSTCTITILIGRFITGLSTGANKNVALVYIGEITDPQIRAVSLYLPGINTIVGTIISHILGYYVPWKLSSMICIGPAVVTSIVFLFLKESPLWLIAKGRIDEGIDSFRWFRGTGEASEMELKTVLERQAEKPKMTVRETLNIVCTMAFLKPMLVLLVVSLSIQLSGINVLRFYSQDVFERTFAGKVDPFILTIAMDCIRGVLPVSLCFLDRFVSRRSVFLTSTFGTPIFVVGLVTCLLVDYKIMWITLFCLVIYTSFSSMLISVGWTFVPEVLPSNARGFGSGLCSGFSYVTLFVIVKTTPDIMNSFGVSTLYAFYGVSTLICGVILYYVLPDTNGKTLQSIEDSYGKNKKNAS